MPIPARWSIRPAIPPSLLSLSLLTLCACGHPASQSPKTTVPDPSAASGTTPIAPGAEVAVGWQKISTIANWARTSLDTTGHFMTGRNACGRPADGVLSLDKWNQLVTAVNTALTLQPLAENKCVDMPRQSKMDGLAEVQIGARETDKRALIDARGYQLCSTIPDPQLVMNIFEGMTAVVEAADKEECPNGWGSG